MTARGEKLRADDNPAVLKDRLAAYREQTAPLTEHYAGKGQLKSVDGMAPIDSVTAAIDRLLADRGKKKRAAGAARTAGKAKPARKSARQAHKTAKKAKKAKKARKATKKTTKKTAKKSSRKAKAKKSSRNTSRKPARPARAKRKAGGPVRRRRGG